MRRAMLALAALPGLLLLPAGGSALTVRASGHSLCSLTPDQMNIVWNALLAYHPPEVAAQITVNAIAVDPRRDTGGARIRITEDTPGEIAPCFIVVVVGDFDASDGIETAKGDGSFTGQGTPIVTHCGTVFMFEGTPSTNVPMTLKVDINL